MKNLYLDKAGLIGSVVTLACCLGFAPVLAALSAIGVGFLINDAVLAPLLLGFLVLGGVGLWLSRRKHCRWEPLGLHAVSAASIFVFTFVAYFQPLIWLGIVGLIGASVWDVVLSRRAACATPNR